MRVTRKETSPVAHANLRTTAIPNVNATMESSCSVDTVFKLETASAERLQTQSDAKCCLDTTHLAGHATAGQMESAIVGYVG